MALPKWSAIMLSGVGGSSARWKLSSRCPPSLAQSCLAHRLAYWLGVGEGGRVFDVEFHRVGRRAHVQRQSRLARIHHIPLRYSGVFWMLLLECCPQPPIPIRAGTTVPVRAQV